MKISSLLYHKAPRQEVTDPLHTHYPTGLRAWTDIFHSYHSDPFLNKELLTWREHLKGNQTENYHFPYLFIEIMVHVAIPIITSGVSITFEVRVRAS